MIKDDELLETFNEIWEKVCNSIKKGFDSEPVYNEKYLKTKIKSFFFKKKKKKPYAKQININFHSDKIPKEVSRCICLSIVLIDSVYRTGKNCYSQVFLEEQKYVVK